MKIVTVLIFSSSSKKKDSVKLWFDTIAMVSTNFVFKRKVYIIIDAKMVNFYAYKTSVCGGIIIHIAWLSSHARSESA